MVKPRPILLLSEKAGFKYRDIDDVALIFEFDKSLVSLASVSFVTFREDVFLDFLNAVSYVHFLRNRGFHASSGLLLQVGWQVGVDT